MGLGSRVTGKHVWQPNQPRILGSTEHVGLPGEDRRFREGGLGRLQLVVGGTKKSVDGCCVPISDFGVESTDDSVSIDDVTVACQCAAVNCLRRPLIELSDGYP
jgi:hypothetical protein